MILGDMPLGRLALGQIRQFGGGWEVPAEQTETWTPRPEQSETWTEVTAQSESWTVIQHF